MSDALEITSDPIISQLSLEETEIPKNYGLFQPETKKNPTFLQIVQQINNHSAYVINTTPHFFESKKPKLSDYNYNTVQENKMEIDAPVPADEQ